MALEIISIANPKGGCGKSTTSMTLSRLSAMDGKRTLLIDLDSNNTSTDSLGIVDSMLTEDVLSHSINCIFNNNPTPLSKLAYPTGFGYDIVLGQFGQDLAETFLMGFKQSELYIADAIFDDELLEENYDRIFLDTGGRTGDLNHAALMASDLVLTPAKASRLDTKQVLELDGYLANVAKQKSRVVNLVDRPLKWAKVFFNEVDTDRVTSVRAIEEFYAQFSRPEIVSEVFIPKSSLVPAAQLDYKHIVDYRPKCAASVNFIDLYNEIFQTEFSNKESK